MPDTILERDHLRIISAKFGWDWLSSFRGEEFKKISFPFFSIFSLVAILVESRDHRTQFWKEAIQGSFHQSLAAQWFLRRRFLCEFPIGSYVKSSSAVTAILVGGMKCRTQFWKGTTQGSFQQSLVEIGSVVSEEKTFLKYHPPFFNS